VEFTDHISPICIPTKDTEGLPAENTPVFLVGWGNTGPMPRYSTDTLKQLTLPMVSTENCTASYPAIFHKETQFCTGDWQTKEGKETCYGDAGGPVMIQDTSNNGAWKQIGIITRVGACDMVSIRNGIKSKVSAFLDFINYYVKDF